MASIFAIASSCAEPSVRAEGSLKVLELALAGIAGAAGEGVAGASTRAAAAGGAGAAGAEGVLAAACVGVEGAALLEPAAVFGCWTVSMMSTLKKVNPAYLLDHTHDVALLLDIVRLDGIVILQHLAYKKRVILALFQSV